MYSDKKRLYFLAILILSILFLSLFIPFAFRRIITAALLAGLAVFVYYLIKKRSILSINKGQVTLIMLLIGLLYLMIYYIPSIEYGFYKNLYALDKLSIFKYIIPISAIIIAIEFIRRIMLAQENKYINVIMYISAILADIIIFASYQSINSYNSLMDMLGMVLFPALSFNILYTFISKRYGMMPNILFRLIITLYLYIIPVVPRTPDVLVAFIQLVLPFIIMIFIKILYDKQRKVVSHTSRRVSMVFSCIGIILMVSIVMLISCQFKYGVLVIATESMTGEIDKGDAVVYEQYEDQIISEGDVIVFEVRDSLVVHRVVKIERINNITRYYTKGDANEHNDRGYITDGQIVGITNFKIKYIGYPSIWVHDLFD